LWTTLSFLGVETNSCECRTSEVLFPEEEAARWTMEIYAQKTIPFPNLGEADLGFGGTVPQEPNQPSMFFFFPEKEAKSVS
jgi:hypothetical protein